MPALTAAPPQANPTAAPSAGGGTVPFFYGSNRYVEKFATDTWQLTTTTSELVHNINPGGFLQGVRVQFRSTGGVGGTASADQPWVTVQSASLENIDGAPIMYPMGGLSYYLGDRFFRPWHGDAAARFDYAAGPNPSMSLFLRPEIRHTAGVLANTDARAQYRVRVTMNTWANVITSGSTAPTFTVTFYLETWAQPDDKDLRDNPIEPLPPGLNLATLRRRQVLAINSASADNQWQLSNTGNEIRGIIAVVRDSNGARQDYLTDPIRWRIDNRSMGVFSPDEVFNRMADFYDGLGYNLVSRPAGVYVWPRFYQPGAMKGEAWLATTNASYVLFESATLSTGTNLPGTVEWITDEVVPVGPVPMEFESI